ncbi:MAG: ribulose-phosphate 3-epimerase [Ruminococcus sp.]|nr:ribulose-phosphate 3-epimerase [Ruminococcus sp.]
MKRNDINLNKKKYITVGASILSADLLNLESEIRKLHKNGVDMIHFDVMDGVFVPNISYGMPVLEAINRIDTDELSMLLDVHLMITDPLKYISAFEKAGADRITFHLESESDTVETIKAIHSVGCLAGIAINPDTPAEAVFPYIHSTEFSYPYLNSFADIILVMTVQPGFGGQQFMDMSDKIRKIREYADKNSAHEVRIAVDGGIDDKTATIVKNAGADILISGSYLFNADDMKKAVRILEA